MTPEITYFDLAMKSYECLDKQLEFACEVDWYNILAAECEQIVEKFMKAVLETQTEIEIDLSLFDKHNLNKLTRVINELYPNTINPEKAAWIKDFYYDARYPGDNCIYVSQYEARQCVKVVKELSEPLIEIYNDLRNLSKQKKKIIGNDERDDL